MSQQSLPATGALTLEGATGPLQAHWELPQEPPRFGALLCHPNPLQGGSMNNKVVTSLARCARRAGGAALRFNFRGVGASGGAHGDGLGEIDDTLLLAQWLRQRLDAPLWLAGFSFGAMVAAHTAVRLASQGIPVASLLLVAPPVHFYQWPELAAADCPVTIIQGDDDELVDADEVERFARQQQAEIAIIRLAECSHFFHGRLPQLMEVATTSLP